ncbi:hypothetical protein [Solibacillus sp. CAU 1738]|uniref:hypothetical protein n=1 Tax=Solibacillus sp. CAU 1738 TaxID=3140363 RepID=UPI0032619F3D
MALSISDVARRHSAFIQAQLDIMERTLQPASQEDEELVRRAVFSVRNKSVIFERFIPYKEILFAAVQDVRPAEVTIDFDKGNITCTCSQTQQCRHQLGVLLGLYQYIGSVQDWASKWRAKKNVQLDLLATERSPESWQYMVDEVLAHILHGNERIESYLFSSTIETAHAKLRRYMPFEREWQPLFKLFMELAVLNKIWAHLNKTNSPVQNDYFEYAIDKRFDIICGLVEELGAKSRLFATDPFYDAIQESVRELLCQQKGIPTKRLNFYLLLWDKVFTEKNRYKQELAIIENIRVETDFPLQAAPTIFYILLKNDDMLQLHLKDIQPEQLSSYLSIVQFSVNQHREATPILLKAILPHLAPFIHEILAPQQRQLFVKGINKFYAEIDLNEQEELMLYAAFGRYGIQPYSDYLLKKERFEEWAALHQLYPSSIPYLEACGLKTVVTAAPSVTLPLYHYYALEEVRQKSRMNYKQAVRIWKAMKSAAKKAGKTTYWTNYIETVRMQYKRLRALQEELDKGNLT